MLTQGVTLNEATGNRDGNAITSKGYTQALVQVSGALNGLVQFLGTVDGTHYQSIGGCNVKVNPALSAFDFETTQEGIWRLDCTGFTSLRADLTNYVSGTITVTLNLTGGP